MSFDMLLNPVSFPGWAMLSILTLLVLNLYVELSGRRAWVTRGIYGYDSIWKRIASNGGAIAIGLSGYSLLGLTFGYAVTIVSYGLLVSTFTDLTSNKAPRELTFFSGLGTLTIILADYFALQVNREAYPGVLYLGATFLTLSIMFIVLKIFSPQGLGMADVRVILMIGLLSYWLGPVYVLTSILIASFTQALVKIVNKLSKNVDVRVWSSKAPFIPALSAGAILGIIPSIFLGI
jgi:prepilin signal peptidase PulO-like enzyme (type II secretory pathway)